MIRPTNSSSVQTGRETRKRKGSPTHWRRERLPIAWRPVIRELVRQVIRAGSVFAVSGAVIQRKSQVIDKKDLSTVEAVESRRVGVTNQIAVDVRVIAAARRHVFVSSNRPSNTAPIEASVVGHSVAFRGIRRSETRLLENSRRNGHMTR